MPAQAGGEIVSGAGSGARVEFFTVEVPDIKDVQCAFRVGCDPRLVDVEAKLVECVANTVEQADLVGCADFDDAEELRRGVVDAHLDALGLFGWQRSPA